MPALSLEERVTALEAEILQLRKEVEVRAVSTIPWWEKIAGTFAQDSAYNEAMKLGRQYRRSLRCRSPRKRKNTHVHP